MKGVFKKTTPLKPSRWAKRSVQIPVIEDGQWYVIISRSHLHPVLFSWRPGTMGRLFSSSVILVQVLVQRTPLCSQFMAESRHPPSIPPVPRFLDVVIHCDMCSEYFSLFSLFFISRFLHFYSPGRCTILGSIILLMSSSAPDPGSLNKLGLARGFHSQALGSLCPA